MEFSPEQWFSLYEHAKKLGLIFLSSAFSNSAFELLNKMNLSAWKIGSGEIGSTEMIKKMIKTNKPLLISTGLASWNDIAKLNRFLVSFKARYAFFQCTTQYPTKFNQIGLNNLDILKKRFNCPVGLSDHSGSITPSLASISRSYEFIEAHIVFDKKMFGPDSQSSLTPDEFRQIINFRNELFQIDNNPVNKNTFNKSLEKHRKFFFKSLALAKPLKAGTRIEHAHLCLKKPGNGLDIKYKNKIIGKFLNKDVSNKRLLKLTDFS